MAITDDQVAALRSYLSAGTDAEAGDAERQFLTLARTGSLDGVEVLVYGAFAAAARRRFSPAWTSADIVRFVADFRSSSAEAASFITASAAENQLRGVLGEKLTTRPDEETRSRVQVILLAVLTTGFVPHELDGLLAEGRALADSLAVADG
jgi:hypothetical protein